MDDRSGSETIRSLERERLRSLVEPDHARAAELHAVDYELIPPSGRRLSRDEYLGMIERGEFTYEVFEPASEITVRIYRDAAVVRYQARIAARWSGGSDRGLYWHTDLYEHRESRWQAVWSQATRIRDAE